MSKPTNEMEWLVDIYSKSHQKPAPKDIEKIKLSRLVSKLGFFYEKFRNAIDYNEEHLVRRNSITRLLRRQILLLQESRSQKISKTLIYEFIRARYLPNDELPETYINDIAVIIEKYLDIVKYLNTRRPPNYKKIIDWALDMAGCEINEEFGPSTKENATANFMYSRLVEDITFSKIEIDEKEKNLQIYIAVLRTFFRADKVLLSYCLLKLYVPNWRTLDHDNTRNFCKNLNIIRNKIDKHIAHPIGFQLARTVRPQSVFFLVIRELLESNQEEIRSILDNPELLEEKIEDIALVNYQKTRGKLIGTIFRVIIYIFFTKTILAFIFELPYDYFILEKIHWSSLAINVTFHPALMFLIALTIRVPGAKNTQIIVQEIEKIVYGQERKIVFKPKKTLKKGSTAFWAFNFVYLVMFGISFGIIIYILDLLKFNTVSGFLFIFFLTIVSFFGFRLRNLAKQFSVLPRKDSLGNFLLDFISLPIIRVGRFISTNFAKVNVFLFIFDFIIETPFKMLVEFLENAVSFINEKREEIVEEQ